MLRMLLYAIMVCLAVTSMGCGAIPNPRQIGDAAASTFDVPKQGKEISMIESTKADPTSIIAHIALQ